MKTRKNIILILLISITLFACGGWYHGHFDDSPTISESKLHGYFRAMYIPNKFILNLADKHVVILDTAWAETMWGYDNNAQATTSEQLGYNFKICLKRFSFPRYHFYIADSKNKFCGGGLGKGGFLIHPKLLHDTIKVFLRDVNPNPDNTTSGWKATILDTIEFIKQKN